MATTPLLGRSRRPLISPRAGVGILLAAAVCVFLAEVTLNNSDTSSELMAAVQQHQEIKSVAPVERAEVAAEPEADAAAEEVKEDDSLTARGQKFLNSIPVMGKNIVQAFTSPVVQETNFDPNAPKVRVDFYMESLCAGCEYFSTNVLTPVLQEPGMGEIVDLHVIPAGNAELKVTEQRNLVSCQHGLEECVGNRIMLCLSDKHRTEPKFLSTFECMEQHNPHPTLGMSLQDTNKTIHEVRATAAKCLLKGGFDAKAILDCADSRRGAMLHELAVNKTSDLKPAYEYAPWVVVDGNALKDDAYSLKEYICNAYKGKKPAECSPALLKDYFPKHSQLHTGKGKGKAPASKTAQLHVQSLITAPFQKCVKGA